MGVDRLPPIDASPEAEVLHRVEELVSRVEAVRAALAEAARVPEPFSAGERALRERLAERDAASAAVGVAITRLVAAGGAVAVRWPAPPPTDPDGVVTLERADAARPSDPPTDPPSEPTLGSDPTPSDALTDPIGTQVPRELDDPPSEPPPAAQHDAERPPPAPAATLAALMQSGLGPSWDAPDRDRRAVAALLEQIGRPARARDLAAARRSVEHLDVVTADLDAWLRFPQPTQQALVGLVGALARHVQDDSGIEPGEPSLKAVFARLSRWSKLYRPGFVSSLSRGNPPQHGSWIADAEHWWGVLSEGGATPRLPADAALRQLEARLRAGLDPAELARAVQEAVDAGVSQSDPKLVRLLLPVAADLAAARGLKTLKSALRAQARASTEDEDTSDRPHQIPADWPFRRCTAGRRAVLLGGDRRPQAAERIREAFGFASVQWEETDPRRVGALADRIRGKGIELVILLRRFLGHAELEVVSGACREADVPFCVVDTGYGVTQIRLAIERYLQGQRR